MDAPEGSPPVRSSDLVIPLSVLKEWNSEMFEDGVEADLHDAGITTLAAAYRQGKEDQIEELIAQFCKRDNK